MLIKFKRDSPYFGSIEAIMIFCIFLFLGNLVCMCAEYCPFIPHMSLSSPFYFLLKCFFSTSPLLFIYLLIYLLPTGFNYICLLARVWMEKCLLAAYQWLYHWRKWHPCWYIWPDRSVLQHIMFRATWDYWWQASYGDKQLLSDWIWGPFHRMNFMSGTLNLAKSSWLGKS